MRNLQILIYLIEILIFLFLIIKRKKLGKEIVYFILAIGTTFITEITSLSWKIFFPQQDTVFIYVIGINFFVFFFIYLYFLKILENKKLKNIQKIILVSFILIYLLSAIFVKDFFKVFPIVSFFINDILLLITIGLFLYETFNTDKILYIKNYYPFWISVALIVIYIGLLPLLIVSTRANSLMTIKLYFGMVFMINLIGYGLMFTGIFFAKKPYAE